MQTANAVLPAAQALMLAKSHIVHHINKCVNAVFCSIFKFIVKKMHNVYRIVCQEKNKWMIEYMRSAILCHIYFCAESHMIVLVYMNPHFTIFFFKHVYSHAYSAVQTIAYFTMEC